MARQPIIDQNHVAGVIARHADFWKHTDSTGILRYTGIYSQSTPIALPQMNGSTITDERNIEPRMVNPDLLIDAIERLDVSELDASLALRGEYNVTAGQGDFLPLGWVLMKMPWIEAMLGCRIEITSGQIWDKEYPGDPEEVASATTSFENNPWLELYVEFIKKMQERLGERFFVSSTGNQRGVSDLAAAVMGVSEAAMGWLDDPACMRRLLRRCTDAVLTLVERTNSVIKPTENGYPTKWGLWCPNKVTCTQADHSSFVSPEVYREQILPFDREVFQSSPMSIMHIHNNGLHHAPALVEVPELDAIQCWLDPYPLGERKSYEVKMLRMIAEHKPLIVDVYQNDTAENEWLLDQLPRRSLFFKTWVDGDVFASLPEDYPGTQLWLRG